MNVLLDENLPHHLRHLFDDGIEVVTVGYRGWKGKENGDLLRLAEQEFDAFITMDQGLSHQQNLNEIKMGIVLLEAQSNRYEDLAPLMDQVHAALKLLRPGQLVCVGSEPTP